MKKIIPKLMICIMFLAGLSLLLYPLISNEWNTYRQEQLISSYDSQVAEKVEAGESDYTAQWDAARALIYKYKIIKIKFLENIEMPGRPARPGILYYRKIQQ